MEGVLDIPHSDRVPKLDELEGGRPLDTDIAGSAGVIDFRFWLGRTDDAIWLAARAEKEAQSHPTVAAGAWHFGLWYFDCAELFLVCSATGRYLEVNLAPNGAYWVGVFDGPRKFAEGVAPETWAVTRTGVVQAEAWSASIALPWASVVEALGGEPDRGNVTAVLDGCPDEGVPMQNLRSEAPIDLDAPDFHVPDRFVALRFK